MTAEQARLEDILRQVNAGIVEEIDPGDLRLMRQIMELFDWSPSEFMAVVESRISEMRQTQKEQS